MKAIVILALVALAVPALAGDADQHPMKTKSGWTPFDGMEVTGWPKATIVRGRIVMRDDELIGSPIGKPVRFQETLQQED